MLCFVLINSVLFHFLSVWVVLFLCCFVYLLYLLHDSHKSSKCQYRQLDLIRGADIAQWFECRTRGRMVLGSIPGRSGGIKFFYLNVLTFTCVPAPPPCYYSSIYNTHTHTHPRAREHAHTHTHTHARARVHTHTHARTHAHRHTQTH